MEETHRGHGMGKGRGAGCTPSQYLNVFTNLEALHIPWGFYGGFTTQA